MAGENGGWTAPGREASLRADQQLPGGPQCHRGYMENLAAADVELDVSDLAWMNAVIGEATGDR